MTHLSAIALTTPLMLLGMTAIAAPILAHLLNRRARRRITFPSIHLLAEARAHQSGLFRLRRLVVLILRCAVMLLIVWAFARPLWVDGAAHTPAEDQPRATVLVLDVSASMAQRVGGVRRIDAMRAQAERFLNALTPGEDRVNVIRADTRPTGVFDEPITNFSVLSDELDAINAGDGRADLPGAIGLAGAQLAGHPGERRVVIMSDMQRTNWNETAPAIESLKETGIRVSIVPIGDRGTGNAGLSRPKCEPTHPIAGATARLSVTVSNHDDVARDATLRAWVNDRVVGIQDVRLEGRGEHEIGFEHTFDAIGHHRIRFGIDDDALTKDNHAYAVTQAVGRVKITLISDTGQRPPHSAYFLSRALAPHGDERDGLEVVPLRSSGVTDAALTGVEAVLISDADTLTETAARAIIGFVRRGGGLMFFCDSGAVLENTAVLNRVSDDVFLPLTPRGVRLHSGDETTLRFGEGAWSTGPMRAFDTLSQQALSSVIIQRTYAVDLADDRVTLLLRFSDDTVSLASRGYGAGRVMTGNFSPDPAFSDLAKHGVFVALMHAIVENLRHQPPTGTTRVVGQSWSYSLGTGGAGGARGAGVEPSGIEVTGPDDAPIRWQISKTETGQSVITERTRYSGFYAVTSGGQELTTMAFNLDPRESDLTRISHEELENALGLDLSDDDSTTLTDTGVLDRAHGSRLWPWLVLGAMGLYAVELLILCVWRR